jgi:hypothetical protein
MKFFLTIIFVILTTNVNSQEIILDNGKIIEDTLSVYKVIQIEDNNNEYIIHVVRDEYHFRIKSSKSDNLVNYNCIEIKEGEFYQLDIRDFRLSETRSYYSSKYQGMGFCQPIGNGEFLCEFDNKSENQYSQVLNLKGLCLIKEE